VLVEGEDITGWDERRLALLRGRRLGFVFQSFHLVPYLTAAQNVALPRRLSGRAVDDARIGDLLDVVGLGDRGGHLPSALSGGQQQRIAVARALANDPAVVLADEPTGALDSRTAHDVLALLRWCVDDLGRTVVMVTHDPRTAAFADSVAFLVDGRTAGRMHRPSPEAVAGQLAHLDQLTGVGAA
jgi:putative ABC transport system ATP-binding protein